MSIRPVPMVLLLAAGAVAALSGMFAYSHWAPPRFDMVAELAKLAEQEGVWDDPWDKPLEKAESLSAALGSASDPLKRFEFRREIAKHYLYAGLAGKAVAELEALEGVYANFPPRFSQVIKSDMALAYLRLGELQNCTWNHNPDSCLFPIEGGGVHENRLGASRAVALYTELLSDPAVAPDDALVYRWLLNIGYMVLGGYPHDVPDRWLIPPRSFDSDHDIGRFRDVALSRGAMEFGLSGGVVLEDFDNDGDLDLMISHFGIKDQMVFFRNDGEGKFSDRTGQAGLTGIVGGLNLVQADYDNDGCIDVLVLRGGWLHDRGKIPNSLLRNGCDGSFTDVTARSGVLSYYPTQTAAWADANNDGRIDLVVGNEVIRDKVPWPESAKNFELYLNDGDGSFSEAGTNSGIQLNGMIKGVVWGDYDNDGWQDLYVSVLGGPNRLFRNRGAGADGTPTFEDVTERAGVAEPIMSFPTWFWDYDNDGWLDIFVSGYYAQLPDIVREYLGRKAEAKGARPRLYRNNRDGTFTDVSRQAGVDFLLLSMGSNFGDLDNDGYPDFYLGTGAPPFETLVPNRMFRNAQGERFQDVTTSGGFGHLQKGHGVAFGDIDNDGDQDVYAVIGGAYESDRFWAALYENPGHGNGWIKLRLTGTEANRFGVGARIRITLVTRQGERRQIFGVVGSGGSFGASSLRPEFGLGDASVIESIDVTWPGSRATQRFNGPIAANRSYEVRQGATALRAIN